MSTNTGEIQVEGGNNTANVNTPENDELIAPPSAPFNPEAVQQSNIVPQDSTMEQSNIQTIPEKKHPLEGWWWKILIVLIVLFLMILFIVWIGPSYIWGDNAKSTNAAQETNTFPPTYIPTYIPTFSPTFSPITILPTFSPSIPTTEPITITFKPTMKPTLCPVEEGTFSDNNQMCDIIDILIETCIDVDNGHTYTYEMDPQGCSNGITCSQVSYCFNNTHYYDGANVYESVYNWYTVGDTIDCTIIKSCEDGACEICSKTNMYQINYVVTLLFIVYFMNVFVVYS
eukprot:191662_1